MRNNPALNGSAEDLHMMGIVPDMPFHDLNLAGGQGTPSPETIARPAEKTGANVETLAPTFSAPDMSVPELAPHDLAGAGVDLRPAFAPDPALPDLDAYNRPQGLAIYPNRPDITDPSLTDLLQYDRPTDLQMMSDLMKADPLLPDLQHPELAPQVQMQDRPGDLDASALQVMHLGAIYQRLEQKAYPEVFMDQSGMNSAQSRHMDLMMRGLDQEER